MKSSKFAFITFFPVKPDNMGSSAVINSRFKNWPYKKKLFQISHKKKINNNNIETILIKKETPINKIIKLPELVVRIVRYFNDAKKKYIIVEGASWIFYSFFVITILKIIFPKIFVIYISHSVEAKIREKYSNKLIYIITKYLENFVFYFSEISTSVSKKENQIIKKMYKKKTTLLPNAISIKHNIKSKEIKKHYIIYTGSYLYKPNKEAIDYLNSIFPKLLNKIPNLKLVLTGGGFDKKFPWLINKGIVSKNRLYSLIYHSKCMCVPLKFGSGTRIKIIEALSLGAVVVSSKKGIEGINLNSKNPPFIFKNEKDLQKIINYIIDNYKRVKKNSLDSKKFYLEKYSMKNVIKKFINENRI
jgi:glycosyltransferase involved in cell wall biosynthesis